MSAQRKKWKKSLATAFTKIIVGLQLSEVCHQTSPRSAVARGAFYCPRGEKSNSRTHKKNIPAKYLAVALAAGLTFFTQVSQGSIVFNETGNLQTYTISDTGSYEFDLLGAGGGLGFVTAATGGLGAEVDGDDYLQAGDVLDIYVGAQGANHTGTIRHGAGSSAGGGGGGGAGAGSGGADGAGGQGASQTGGSANAGGGAGFLSDGGLANGIANSGGFSLTDGAAGGVLSGGASGGYGGGGAGYWAGGGGGGYSGGGAAAGYTLGGGGGVGSYFDPNGIANFMTSGVKSGSGLVTITPVPEPSAFALLGLGVLALGIAVRRRRV